MIQWIHGATLGCMFQSAQCRSMLSWLELIYVMHTLDLVPEVVDITIY